MHSTKHYYIISRSAVEWSGVFVLVDYLTQRLMKGDDSVDIPAVTLQLLDERKSLITEVRSWQENTSKKKFNRYNSSVLTTCNTCVYRDQYSNVTD